MGRPPKQFSYEEDNVNEFEPDINVVERIKRKILPAKKPDLLTPELENEIRMDERIKFAQSFNFQSLFAETEQKANWLQWIPVGLVILNLIILWKV